MTRRPRRGSGGWETAGIISRVSQYRGKETFPVAVAPRRRLCIPRKRVSSTRIILKTKRARGKRANIPGDSWGRERFHRRGRNLTKLVYHHILSACARAMRERKFLRFFMLGRMFKIHFGLPSRAQWDHPAQELREIREWSFRLVDVKSA